MNRNDICTPAILLDLDCAERNLKRFSDAARRHGKEIWPMIKTHKSTELARLQAAFGCTGYLCGTLDEAEALAGIGAEHIMYAYPVAKGPSVARVVALAEKTDFILRLDSAEAAPALDAAAARAAVKLSYTLIINAGLNRFGVPPEQAAALADALRPYEHLVMRGISTHPGHVYAATRPEEIGRYVAEERAAVAAAVKALRAAGYEPEIVSSGSTPTFLGAVADENIRIFHPGNYIFNDAIQLSTGTAAEEDCALSVLTTVISHPREDLFLCDAGAKCLGLDKGAHGNDAIKGYGRVKGHPELEVFSLSEEEGKLHVHGETALRIGDRIQIIPNHACSTANLTSWMVGLRGGEPDHLIPVDLRGNSVRRPAELA